MVDTLGKQNGGRAGRGEAVNPRKRKPKIWRALGEFLLSRAAPGPTRSAGRVLLGTRCSKVLEWHLTK